MRYEEFIKEQFRKLDSSGLIESAALPDMELYMDQAATVLKKSFEELDGDIAARFAARQLINNYAKRDLIARPEGKRYSKEHMLMIVMVIYLRGMFKIDEIRSIMKPLVDNYNSKYDDTISLQLLYETAEELSRDSIGSVKMQVDDVIGRIKKKLEETDLENDQRMEVFVLILTLSMRADMEKYLVKRLAEMYFMEPQKEQKEKKEKKEKPKKNREASSEEMSEL